MAKNDFYLKVLESAIFIKHECKATHRETVFVQETTPDNETVWTGYVEVFDLAWHETATMCYAWIHISENEPAKIFALPRNQVIDSPRRAVQAAIFSDAQPVIPPPSVSAKLLGGGTCVTKSQGTPTVELSSMAKVLSKEATRRLRVHP